jgi:hypothetical protein
MFPPNSTPSWDGYPLKWNLLFLSVGGFIFEAMVCIPFEQLSHAKKHKMLDQMVTDPPIDIGKATWEIPERQDDFTHPGSVLINHLILNDKSKVPFRPARSEMNIPCSLMMHTDSQELFVTVPFQDLTRQTLLKLMDRTCSSDCPKVYYGQRIDIPAEENQLIRDVCQLRMCGRLAAPAK